ncbi:MAG: HlyD family efflux transporter periplasmic adaptor subunit [candidate division WOR-3 bacterium]
MKKLKNLILILAIISCQNRADISSNEENIIPVSITRPKISSIEYSEVYTANITGEPLIFVFPEVPGKFIRYEVLEGQYVNKGDVIAYLDRDITGLEFKEYPIKAPSNGRVHLLNINLGQLVSPSTPIAQIYGNPVAVIKLPSVHYNKIKVGDKIKIYSDEFSIEEISVIYYKSSIIDPLTQTFEIRAKVSKFPIGSFANAKITLEKKERTLIIPTSSILGLDKKFVFVLDNGKAYKRLIKVGISNEEYTEVLEGLSENYDIVVEGQYNLQDGSKVRVVR